MNTAPHKILVLGTAPTGFTPSDGVVAGSWCVMGLRENDPEQFRMPEEPFASAVLLEQAARQARHLVATLAPRIAAFLKIQLYLAPETRRMLARNKFPGDRYWDFVLAPWLTRFAEILVDRLYRTDALLESFGEETLTVPVLPDSCSFDFADTQDFIQNGLLDPQWNHWLLSRLLERNWPEKWTKEELPAIQRGPHFPVPESLPRRLARAMVFALPFPHIKGFSLKDSLCLSAVLVANSNSQDDTIPLSALRDDAFLASHPLPLGFTVYDADKLAKELIPRALWGKSIAKSLTDPLLPPAVPGKTRVVSVAACEDDAYRLRVAKLLARSEKTCRLMFIQHGGEYGFVRSSVAYPTVEYRMHRFITWGWNRHGDLPGNFLPLPHPQLAAIRNSHRENAPVLLLVGTEMAALPYTLKSMLRGRQFFAYRQDKARFLSALNPDIRGQTSYRPYFDNPAYLEDGPWLLRRFPEVTRCTGALEPHLLGCRLLVLDHAGTTLGQALAANVPFLLYWRPADSPEQERFTPEVLPLLDGLRRAGILFDTPEDAAAQVGRIWNDVSAWWRTTAPARDAWAAQHALTVDGPYLPIWAKALRQV